jgi:hypothetical protein
LHPQALQRLGRGRPRYTPGRRQLPLGRDLVARLQITTHDLIPDVACDLEVLREHLLQLRHQQPHNAK